MTRPPRSLFARRAGSEKPRRKWTLRSLLCRVLPLYLLYFVLGATLPFLSPPTVSDSFRAAWDPAVFEQVGSTDRAALVTDNQDALDVRLRMIGEAEERIILSSFDIRDCDSGRDIFAALLLAADRGVQIQILWDGVSGLLRGGSPIFRALGRLPNVEIRFYNAPNLLLPWTVNGRMHDKYLLIDDRLLLLGGRNTFDLFLGDYVPDALKSHDQDVLVYNTAAGTEQSGAHTVLTQVEAYFQSVWESPYSRTVLDRPPLFPGKSTGRRRNCGPGTPLWRPPTPLYSTPYRWTMPRSPCRWSMWSFSATPPGSCARSPGCGGSSWPSWAGRRSGSFSRPPTLC